MSDYESISLSTDNNNPTIMSYDGFIVSNNNSSGITTTIYVNNVKMDLAVGGGPNLVSIFTIPICKGDEVYTNRSFTLTYARWYKNRNYSNR